MKNEIWLKDKPCIAMKQKIYLKENWEGDLPGAAPKGKCYFDHAKDCSEKCDYYIKKNLVFPHKMEIDWYSVNRSNNPFDPELFGLFWNLKSIRIQKGSTMIAWGAFDDWEGWCD